MMTMLLMGSDYSCLYGCLSDGNNIINHGYNGNLAYEASSPTLPANPSAGVHCTRTVL